jgi:hypothetical protein
MKKLIVLLSVLLVFVCVPKAANGEGRFSDKIYTIKVSEMKEIPCSSWTLSPGLFYAGDIQGTAVFYIHNCRTGFGSRYIPVYVKPGYEFELFVGDSCRDNRGYRVRLETVKGDKATVKTIGPAWDKFR